MADQQLGTINLNWTDARKSNSISGTSTAQEGSLLNFADTQNILTLRTALNTFDPFTYTQTVLNQMSVNDMLFAWRAAKGNQASISNYHPAQVARTS